MILLHELINPLKGRRYLLANRIKAFSMEVKRLASQLPLKIKDKQDAKQYIYSLVRVLRDTRLIYGCEEQFQHVVLKLVYLLVFVA